MGFYQALLGHLALGCCFLFHQSSELCLTAVHLLCRFGCSSVAGLYLSLGTSTQGICFTGAGLVSAAGQHLRLCVRQRLPRTRHLAHGLRLDATAALQDALHLCAVTL